MHPNYWIFLHDIEIIGNISAGYYSTFLLLELLLNKKKFLNQKFSWRHKYFLSFYFSSNFSKLLYF